MTVCRPKGRGGSPPAARTVLVVENGKKWMAVPHQHPGREGRHTGRPRRTRHPRQSQVSQLSRMSHFPQSCTILSKTPLHVLLISTAKTVRAAGDCRPYHWTPTDAPFYILYIFYTVNFAPLTPDS